MLIVLPDGDTLRIAAAEGESAYGVAGMDLEYSGSKAGRVLERGRSERIDSVLDDPEIDQQAARRLGVHSGLYVPLIVRGKAIGVVIAHDKRGHTPVFAEDDLRLAETLASRAAVAVDLSTRVSRDAVRRVVEAQELERARLARELHDETGQALTSILLALKPLEQAAETDEARDTVASIRELVVSTLQDVRRLAVELRPSALDDFGLVPAVQRLTETFREQSGLHVDLETQLGDERLPREAETALYRVVQEAFTNVIKHSGAEPRERPPAAPGRQGRRRHRGRRGRVRSGQYARGRGRARRDARAGRAAGGRLQVESTSGAGTTLVAEVPVL